MAFRDCAGSCVTYEVLAQLIVTRYRNYKAFEQQVETMAVSGMPVTRQLVYGWLANIAQALVPVAEAIRATALTSNILSCANRPIRVKGAASRRLWVYEGRVEARSAAAPFGSPHIIWFRATPDRLGAYARRELAGFKGILQALPSTGYDGFTQDAGVTVFGCWRQIERQAQELARTTEHPVMVAMLRDMESLRAIEAECAQMTWLDRAAVRQQRSAPIMMQMRAWLEEASRDVFAASRLGVFLADVLARWPVLSLFVKNAALDMDGGAATRRIERLVNGDPSVFTWHRNADSWAATIYTVLETCVANGADEHGYLVKILSHFGNHADMKGHSMPMPWNSVQADPVPA